MESILLEGRGRASIRYLALIYSEVLIYIFYHSVVLLYLTEDYLDSFNSTVKYLDSGLSLLIIA